MALCRQCGKEIKDGVAVCEHCHAKLGTPKRPTGVTVIAILALLGSLFALFGMVGLNKSNSIIFGFRVPLALARIVRLFFAGIEIYCGIGLLMQTALARKIYIWVLTYSIVNTLTSTFIPRHSILRHLKRLPAGVEGYAIIGTIIGIAILGWMLYYLIRHKDYFPN